MADIWTTRAPMPTARFILSCGVVNGKIYAIGGLPDNTTVCSRAVEEYDPATDTWTRKANLPKGRGAGSCATVNGVIYFAGGGYTGATGTDQAVSKVEAYDPATDTWTTKAPMRTVRGMFATSVMNGKIYAIGGCNGAYDSSERSSMEAYDPATDTWWTMPNMQVKRKALASAVVNGEIYAIGGVSTGGWVPPLSTVEEYDPKPTVSLLRTGSTLKISWNGILESSDTVDGPSWQALNSPTWPYSISLAQAGPMKFYRAREP